MKGLRQLSGFHDDLRVDGQKGHAGFGERTFNPKPDRPIKPEATAFHKFCNFPTGNDADPKDSIRTEGEKIAMPRLQSVRP